VLAQLLELGQQLLVLALQELDAVDVLGEAVVQLAEHLLLLVALLADGHHRHGLHWRQLVVVAVGRFDSNNKILGFLKSKSEREYGLGD